MQTMTNTAERGFASGEHIVIRPVLVDDLRDLARLMAENPYDHDVLPWTYQRLKQKFEDQNKPGLWSHKEKTYTVARQQGAIAGFIRESVEEDTKHWCGLHVGMSEPNRDAWGRDTVATYLGFKLRWFRPLRISFALLQAEEQKCQWLDAAGFEMELVFERSYLHQGQPAAVVYYTWCADWALAMRAEPCPVAGEEDPRRGT